MDLKQKLPSFHYFPTFSREQSVAEGLNIGYVHGIYQQLLQEQRDSPRFFLCGWKDMITEARQRIQQFGIDKKSIHFELYG
jgi:CDP-4-dehydro-6-deoxyglucose reductase